MMVCVNNIKTSIIKFLFLAVMNERIYDYDGIMIRDKIMSVGKLEEKNYEMKISNQTSRHIIGLSTLVIRTHNILLVRFTSGIVSL